MLKRYYTSHAKKYYLNEIAAFETLKDSKDAELAIINYHGSFRLDGTFNILLEYADGGTLEDAFQNTNPPVTTAQEAAFWRGMLNICRAIKAVHNLADKRYAHTLRKNRVTDRDRWHQDVKPSNILLLDGNASTPNEQCFKLADLSNSHFRHDIDLDNGLLDDDSYGTRTYGMQTLNSVPILVY